MSSNGNAILFLLPSSAFREEEYFSARQALEKRGLRVVVASTVKSGAIGTVHATTSAYPGFPERIELIGTRGTAQLEGTSLKVQIQDQPAFSFSSESGAGGTGADPMAFPHDWHRGVLTDFLDSIEQNRDPRVSGAEALKVHRFIDRILQSAG